MLSLAGLVEACFYTGGDFKRMKRAAAKAALLLERRGCESAEARARLLLAFGTACFFTGRLDQGFRTLAESGMPICNCILLPGMETGPWLRIYCLGGFRVERNQAPVTEKEWKGRFSKTLLKLLAAGTGRGITLDAAIDALWPEHGDRDKSLLTVLYTA